MQTSAGPRARPRLQGRISHAGPCREAGAQRPCGPRGTRGLPAHPPDFPASTVQREGAGRERTQQVPAPPRARLQAPGAPRALPPDAGHRTLEASTGASCHTSHQGPRGRSAHWYSWMRRTSVPNGPGSEQGKDRFLNKGRALHHPRDPSPERWGAHAPLPPAGFPVALRCRGRGPTAVGDGQARRGPMRTQQRQRFPRHELPRSGPRGSRGGRPAGGNEAQTSEPERLRRGTGVGKHRPPAAPRPRVPSGASSLPAAPNTGPPTPGLPVGHGSRGHGGFHLHYKSISHQIYPRVTCEFG